MDSFDRLHHEVVACRRCPRLVEWRERVAREKTRRFADQEYWGRPVPGFGDPNARLWLIGLAPAAHGANRTGRMFTGDRSGDWLFAALHRAGFASRPEAFGRDDGLTLVDCYISAAVRCAPPANKPEREEYENCAPYLERELALLTGVNTFLCMGGIAFTHTLRLLQRAGYSLPSPRPRFAHGAEHEIPGGIRLLASYHPSQQNTFTGRLTVTMLDEIMRRAAELVAR